MERTRNGAISLFFFTTLVFIRHVFAAMCGAQSFDPTLYICYNQTLPAILCPFDSDLRCGQACYAESRDTCVISTNPPYLIGDNLQPCGTTTIQEFDPSKYICNYLNDGTSQLCDIYHPQVCGIACYDPKKFVCSGTNLGPQTGGNKVSQPPIIVPTAATKYVTSSCTICTTYPTPSTPTIPVVATMSTSSSSFTTPTTTTTPPSISTTTTTATSTSTLTPIASSSFALYQTVIIVTITITIAQPISLLGQGLYADGSIDAGPGYVTLTQASGGVFTDPTQGTLWIYPTLVNAQKIYLYTVGYPPPNVCTVFDVTGVPACPTIIINPQLFIQTAIYDGPSNGGPVGDTDGDDDVDSNDGNPSQAVTQYTLAVADNVAAGSSSAALVLSYGTSGSQAVITVPATASSAAQESAYSMFYSQFNSVQGAQSVNNDNLYSAATMFSIAQQASAAAAASAAISSYQSAASAASQYASSFISSYLSAQSAASQSDSSEDDDSGISGSGIFGSGGSRRAQATPPPVGGVEPTVATVTQAPYMPKRVVHRDSSLNEGVKTSARSDQNKGFNPRRIFARRGIREMAM